MKSLDLSAAAGIDLPVFTSTKFGKEKSFINPDEDSNSNDDDEDEGNEEDSQDNGMDDGILSQDSDLMGFGRGMTNKMRVRPIIAFIKIIHNIV